MDTPDTGNVPLGDGGSFGRFDQDQLGVAITLTMRSKRRDDRVDFVLFQYRHQGVFVVVVNHNDSSPGGFLGLGAALDVQLFITDLVDHKARKGDAPFGQR